MKKPERWNTASRNKYLVCGLIFMGLCNLIILYGWLILMRKDAHLLLVAIDGPGGLWAILNAFAVSMGKKQGANP